MATEEEQEGEEEKACRTGQISSSVPLCVSRADHYQAGWIRNPKRTITAEDIYALKESLRGPNSYNAAARARRAIEQGRIWEVRELIETEGGLTELNARSGDLSMESYELWTAAYRPVLGPEYTAIKPGDVIPRLPGATLMARGLGVLGYAGFGIQVYEEMHDQGLTFVPGPMVFHDRSGDFTVMEPMLSSKLWDHLMGVSGYSWTKTYISGSFSGQTFHLSEMQVDSLKAQRTERVKDAKGQLTRRMNMLLYGRSRYPDVD